MPLTHAYPMKEMMRPIRLAWLCLSLMLSAARLPAQQLILQVSEQDPECGRAVTILHDPAADTPQLPSEPDSQFSGCRKAGGRELIVLRS